MILLVKFFILIMIRVELLSYISLKLKLERKILESRDYVDILISLISIGSVYFKMGNEIEGIKLF